MAKVITPISFDDQNRIRILADSDYKKTESLAEECTSFVSKIGQFENSVQSLVEILASQAEKIEKQKLMAIGLRNKVDSEPENRKRQQEELLAELSQKRAEMDRYTVQIESLVKTEQEQRTLLDHLQTTE